MRLHVYEDVSDLSARWDQIPLRGLGAGILTRGGQGSLSGGYLGALGALGAVRGLGVTYTEGPDVETLQTQVNQDLKKLGCVAIDVDGKLGPGTCGAARYVTQKFIQDEIADTVMDADLYADLVGYCKSFTYSCKPAAPPPSRPPTAPPTDEEPPRVRRAGMSDTTWLLIGGGVAAAAVGLAFYMRKKRG